jgi:hypothetical protein
MKTLLALMTLLPVSLSHGGAPAQPAGATVPPPAAPTAPVQAAKSAGAVEAVTVAVPGSGYKLTFVPIAGDAANGIEPFWMCTTELPWDAFDVYVFKLDEPEENRYESDRLSVALAEHDTEQTSTASDRAAP